MMCPRRGGPEEDEDTQRAVGAAIASHSDSRLVRSMAENSSVQRCLGHVTREGRVEQECAAARGGARRVEGGGRGVPAEDDRWDEGRCEGRGTRSEGGRILCSIELLKSKHSTCFSKHTRMRIMFCAPIRFVQWLFVYCESKKVFVLLIGLFVLCMSFHLKCRELPLCPLCGKVHIEHPP